MATSLTCLMLRDYRIFVSYVILISYNHIFLRSSLPLFSLLFFSFFLFFSPLLPSPYTSCFDVVHIPNATRLSFLHVMFAGFFRQQILFTALWYFCGLFNILLRISALLSLLEIYCLSFKFTLPFTCQIYCMSRQQLLFEVLIRISALLSSPERPLFACCRMRQLISNVFIHAGALVTGQDWFQFFPFTSVIIGGFFWSLCQNCFRISAVLSLLEFWLKVAISAHVFSVFTCTVICFMVVSADSWSTLHHNIMKAIRVGPCGRFPGSLHNSSRQIAQQVNVHTRRSSRCRLITTLCKPFGQFFEQLYFSVCFLHLCIMNTTKIDFYSYPSLILHVCCKQITQLSQSYSHGLKGIGYFGRGKLKSRCLAQFTSVLDETQFLILIDSMMQLKFLNFKVFRCFSTVRGAKSMFYVTRHFNFSFFLSRLVHFSIILSPRSICSLLSNPLLFASPTYVKALTNYGLSKISGSIRPTVSFTFVILSLCALTFGTQQDGRTGDAAIATVWRFYSFDCFWPIFELFRVFNFYASLLVFQVSMLSFFSLPLPFHFVFFSSCVLAFASFASLLLFILLLPSLASIPCGLVFRCCSPPRFGTALALSVFLASFSSAHSSPLQPQISDANLLSCSVTSLSEREQFLLSLSSLSIEGYLHNLNEPNNMLSAGQLPNEDVSRVFTFHELYQLPQSHFDSIDSINPLGLYLIDSPPQRTCPFWNVTFGICLLLDSYSSSFNYSHFRQLSYAAFLPVALLDPPFLVFWNSPISLTLHRLNHAVNISLVLDCSHLWCFHLVGKRFCYTSIACISQLTEHLTISSNDNMCASIELFVSLIILKFKHAICLNIILAACTYQCGMCFSVNVDPNVPLTLSITGFDYNYWSPHPSFGTRTQQTLNNGYSLVFHPNKEFQILMLHICYNCHSVSALCQYSALLSILTLVTEFDSLLITDMCVNEVNAGFLYDDTPSNFHLPHDSISNNPLGSCLSFDNCTLKKQNQAQEQLEQGQLKEWPHGLTFWDCSFFVILTLINIANGARINNQSKTTQPVQARPSPLIEFSFCVIPHCLSARLCLYVCLQAWLLFSCLFVCVLASWLIALFCLFCLGCFCLCLCFFLLCFLFLLCCLLLLCAAILFHALLILLPIGSFFYTIQEYC